jgi:lipopolysaccharide transport protein LptA
MNRPLLTILLVAGLAVVSNAQTNVPTAAGKDIEISSRKGEFDLKAKTAVYSGGVRVEGQGMLLTCETLTAKLPATGNRLESFVGESNVVVNFVDEKGQKTHATGEKLVYTFAVSETTTNETIELQGNPVLETPQGPMTGKAMIYDRTTSKLRVDQPNAVLRPETAGKTNQVVSPANAPETQPAPP